MNKCDRTPERQIMIDVQSVVCLCMCVFVHAFLLLCVMAMYAYISKLHMG